MYVSIKLPKFICKKSYWFMLRLWGTTFQVLKHNISFETVINRINTVHHISSEKMIIFVYVYPKAHQYFFQRLKKPRNYSFSAIIKNNHNKFYFISIYLIIYQLHQILFFFFTFWHCCVLYRFDCTCRFLVLSGCFLWPIIT